MRDRLIYAFLQDGMDRLKQDLDAVRIHTRSLNDDALGDLFNSLAKYLEASSLKPNRIPIASVAIEEAIARHRPKILDSNIHCIVHKLVKSTYSILNSLNTSTELPSRSSSVRPTSVSIVSIDDDDDDKSTIDMVPNQQGAVLQTSTTSYGDLSQMQRASTTSYNSPRFASGAVGGTPLFNSMQPSNSMMPPHFQGMHGVENSSRSSDFAVIHHDPRMRPSMASVRAGFPPHFGRHHHPYHRPSISVQSAGHRRSDEAATAESDATVASVRSEPLNPPHSVPTDGVVIERMPNEDEDEGEHPHADAIGRNNFSILTDIGIDVVNLQMHGFNVVTLNFDRPTDTLPVGASASTIAHESVQRRPAVERPRAAEWDGFRPVSLKNARKRMQSMPPPPRRQLFQETTEPREGTGGLVTAKEEEKEKQAVEYDDEESLDRPLIGPAMGEGDADSSDHEEQMDEETSAQEDAPKTPASKKRKRSAKFTYRKAAKRAPKPPATAGHSKKDNSANQTTPVSAAVPKTPRRSVSWADHRQEVSPVKHVTPGRTECEFCGGKFARLSEHIQHIHKSEIISYFPHPCRNALCDMRYRLPFGLKVHESKHSAVVLEKMEEDGAFNLPEDSRCPTCKITVNTLLELKHHTIQHNYDMPHDYLACEDCNHQFSFIGDLLNHWSSREECRKGAVMVVKKVVQKKKRDSIE